MQPMKCSSNPYSELNHARRALWCAKDMLGAANREPDKYSKSFWMGRINYYRAELRKLAYRMRAEQCTRTE